MRSDCRLNADVSSLQQCSNNISVIEDNLNYDLHLLEERLKMAYTIKSTKTKSCTYKFLKILNHFLGCLFVCLILQ